MVFYGCRAFLYVLFEGSGIYFEACVVRLARFQHPEPRTLGPRKFHERTTWGPNKDIIMCILQESPNPSGLHQTGGGGDTVDGQNPALPIIRNIP